MAVLELALLVEGSASAPPPPPPADGERAAGAEEGEEEVVCWGVELPQPMMVLYQYFIDREGIRARRGDTKNYCWVVEGGRGLDVDRASDVVFVLDFAPSP